MELSDYLKRECKIFEMIRDHTLRDEIVDKEMIDILLEKDYIEIRTEKSDGLKYGLTDHGRKMYALKRALGKYDL